ncbi:DUF2690 domain-containing protein [Streptomyces xantholiticus]|uniref:DUF2690 domain-containing protein n=1 Tax=Streptomyces xantholiticus TaxID=68285 RepID=UPI0016733D11|nr:DUF2690 domain-containing protein [Streptomyces xantholiticus]GGW43437.1 hypothetical protein GCM10010381_30560 [Streptomyces xantholiticus]
MPRWKELPEELDPEVREFTGQLRGLVDRSGLSISAVSDRTGYSKTSWERYLNGRLLAPKGAVVALAEVTGTDTVHVTTMWELAERAWSRAEMRHDMTMEAIRISQAREALGGDGAASGAPGGRGSTGSGATGGRSAGHGPGGGSAGNTWPTVTESPYGPGPYGAAAAPAPGAGARPPHQGGEAASAPSGPAGTARRRRKAPFVAAAVVSVLIVGTGGWFLVSGEGGDGREDRATPTPSVTPTTSSPKLPAGVKCNGDDCAGQDPETMGCGGEYARTVSTATVGKAVIEVRYSEVCGAGWARITQAVPGDEVRIAVGGKARQSALVNDNDAYTPMAAVPDPADVKACTTLKTGTEGCTSGQ